MELNNIKLTVLLTSIKLTLCCTLKIYNRHALTFSLFISRFCFSMDIANQHVIDFTSINYACTEYVDHRLKLFVNIS